MNEQAAPTDGSQFLNADQPERFRLIALRYGLLNFRPLILILVSVISLGYRSKTRIPCDCTCTEYSKEE